MAETFDRTLLSGVTTGTGPVEAMGVYDQYESSVDWGAGVSAGVVGFEWSPTPGFAGTWFTLATHTFSAPSIVTRVLFQVVGGYVRARVSTPVTGGVITVRRSLQITDK
jgi:hypothetical protein